MKHVSPDVSVNVEYLYSSTQLLPERLGNRNHDRFIMTFLQHLAQNTHLWSYKDSISSHENSHIPSARLSHKPYDCHQPAHTHVFGQREQKCRICNHRMQLWFTIFAKQISKQDWILWTDTFMRCGEIKPRPFCVAVTLGFNLVYTCIGEKIIKQWMLPARSLARQI